MPSSASPMAVPASWPAEGTYNFSKKDDTLNFEFTGEDLTNFSLTIFSLKYEFLKISNGSAIKSDVPYSIGYSYNNQLETFANYDKTKDNNEKFQNQNEKKENTYRRHNTKGKTWSGLADTFNKK